MYVCMYIYVYICICIYIYIHFQPSLLRKHPQVPPQTQTF